jgi:hypothetical protein
MNMRSRLDELREIAQGNIMMMKKLQDARPSIEVRKIEQDSLK